MLFAWIEENTERKEIFQYSIFVIQRVFHSPFYSHFCCIRSPLSMEFCDVLLAVIRRHELILGEGKTRSNNRQRGGWIPRVSIKLLLELFLSCTT